MTAYTMQSLYGSQRNEIYGTDTTTYDSNDRTVYTVTARLKIDKLDGPGGNVDPNVAGFSKAVYESFGTEGPGGYGAEINVAGKLLYGYTWQLRDWPGTAADKAGWWRITFSLDQAADIGGTSVPNNTKIVGTNFGTYSDSESAVEIMVNQ